VSNSDVRPEGGAMTALRSAVADQLGTERPPPAAVDPEDVVRLSPDLPRELSAAERERLSVRAEELQPWLQGPFLLGGDLVVGGAWRNDWRWQSLGEELPDDLAGMRVLDVGSNAGYDPFMFRLRGADHVLACEPFEFIEQARFLESIYQSGVDFQQIGWQVLDPGKHGLFDLVHCHGVLYHELDPAGLVRRLRDMTAPGGTVLLGSMMLADPMLSEYARFVPGSYYGDPTWWWVPGRLVLRWLVEASGLDLEDAFGEHPGPAGEFETVNGYVRATRGERDPGPHAH
jgi:SAM-dependent methyltransferase